MRKKNNSVQICGCLTETLKFSHEVFGEKFYKTTVGIERYSGTLDEIPVIVSERAVDITAGCRADDVSLKGEFRSRNRGNDGKGKLELFVFADEFYLSDKPDCKWENTLFLDGHICRKPVYRKLLHGREITEFLVKIQRAYNRFDYIPCICWGRNARYVNTLDVGTHMLVIGRIQSRSYRKKISEDQYEIRTAYEVSANKLEVLNDENGAD